MTILSTDGPTTCDPSVFYRELQNNYSILPQSSTIIPTECDPSVFYRELQKNYSPYHNHRRIYRCIHRWMSHIPTRMTVRLPGRSTQLSTDLPTEASNPIRVCSNTRLPTNSPMDVKKNSRDFQNFMWISKNTDRNYRRNLMPPPKKNIILLSIGNSIGKLQYKTNPPLRVLFFRGSSNFFSSQYKSFAFFVVFLLFWL